MNVRATRANCPGCSSVPGAWICLVHGLSAVTAAARAALVRDAVTEALAIETLEIALRQVTRPCC